MNAQPGRKPTRKEKHDAALKSAEKKLAKKGITKKSVGSKVWDILRGNA